MTCCIAIKCQGGIVVAADTEVTLGQVRSYRAHKIVRGKSGFLMGAGEGGPVDLLMDDWKERGGTFKTLLELIRAGTVPARWRDAVEFLYAGRHGARVIDGNGCVMTSRYPFATIGAGTEVAIGYLGALVSPQISAVEACSVARRTLAFVANNVSGVGGPAEVQVLRWSGANVLSVDPDGERPSEEVDRRGRQRDVSRRKGKAKVAASPAR